MSEFFDSRPILAHVRDTARARMVSPWATLGVVLARAVAATPPEVQLPPLTGGPQSLNLFIALVGRPGQGKGAAEATGRAAVRFVKNNGTDPHVLELSVGSGEGIARTFRPRGTSDDEPNPEKSALFSVPEVDTLGALGKRQGSTLLSQVRSVYSGERLGFANAGPDTRVIVEPHSYRACMTVGVQPAKSRHLLDDSDGGTPQRFLWLPTIDPHAPDDTPPCPDPITVTAPSWGPGDTILTVVQSAKDQIIAQRREALRGSTDVDPLDGHRFLTRLKVAAALMLLDGRGVVSDDDWQLAGQLIEVSRITRESCQREIKAKAKEANVARAHAAEERNEEHDRIRHERAVKYVLARIDRQGGECTRRDLTQGTKSELRPYLDAALEDLDDRGVIVAEDIDGGTRFSLTARSNGPTVRHRNSQVEALDRNALDSVGPTKPQVNRVGLVGPGWTDTDNLSAIREHLLSRLSNVHAFDYSIISDGLTPTQRGHVPAIVDALIDEGLATRDGEGYKLTA